MMQPNAKHNIFFLKTKWLKSKEKIIDNHFFKIKEIKNYKNEIKLYNSKWQKMDNLGENKLTYISKKGFVASKTDPQRTGFDCELNIIRSGLCHC